MTIAAAKPTVAPNERLPLHAVLRTAWALFSRDMAVLLHGLLGFLLRTAMQPLLFAFVFAYVFPHIGQGIGGSGRGSALFATILLPGMMATSIMFQGIQAVALPLVQEFSFSREIEDRVMAPVPTWVVGLTKVMTGAVQGVIAAILVVPLVWIASGRTARVDWSHPLEFVTLLALAAMVSASLGLVLGTVVTPRRINYLFAVLLLPMTLLGCVYYPWSALGSLRWLQIVVLANPVVYMSEGLRAALVPGIGHISLWGIYGLLLGAITLLLAVGLRSFRARVIS